MIHATYITSLSSAKEAVLGLPQLGVRFLACWQQQLESERNAKLQNCEADAQSMEPAGFWLSLHSLAL